MILVVGSSSPSTAKFSIKKNLGQSKLFTGQQITDNVYHTSLADCPNLEHYIHHFQSVYWANSKISEFNSFKEYFDTIFLLKNLPNIIGLDDDPYNVKLCKDLNTSPDNIIFLGCSHTQGGLLENQRLDYTNIVASHFDLNPLNLAEGGKGNFRSFDQFNKIRFHRKQIVVLQLTDFARLRYFKNESPDCKVEEAQLHAIKDRSYIKVFNDKQLLYTTLSRLESIVVLSKALDLRFVFFYLGNVPNFDNSVENDDYKKMIEYYLTDFKEYIPNILEQNIDRAPDNLHFGPKSNAMWADKIICKIQNLYHDTIR